MGIGEVFIIGVSLAMDAFSVSVSDEMCIRDRLKMMVDAVQSAKFITLKKSNELSKKLETLCSRHDAQILQRQVYVQKRVKTMNESIYYHVDKISMGIAECKQISFLYLSLIQI